MHCTPTGDRVNTETFPAHDALEDIRALRRCVPELVNLGIIELAQKEYPSEQLKAQFEPEKPKGGRNIEFHDPNPVTEPIGTGEPVPEPTPERPAVPSNSKTRELFQAELKRYVEEDL